MQSLLYSHYIIAALVVVALACIVIAVCVYRHQRLLKVRAELMRMAIRHRDFSFRLPTKGMLFGERALQEALNDMGEEIQKLVAHDEVEAWQRLTRVLTHEIMNATTPIQSISQAYLSNPAIKGSLYEEGMQAIHDTSRGLADFVDSYRKLTQLQDPVMRDINLRDFLLAISSLYSDLYWDIDVPPSIILSADESLLRQVFINMVKNAVEADAHTIALRHVQKPSPLSPLMPIRGEKDTKAQFCKLQISNDGHVIPDDVAREIFIPFFTTKSTGSGIGLSLSRQILMKQRLSLSLREIPVDGYNVTFEMESEM